MTILGAVDCTRPLKATMNATDRLNETNGKKEMKEPKPPLQKE